MDTDVRRREKVLSVESSKELAYSTDSIGLLATRLLRLALLTRVRGREHQS